MNLIKSIFLSTVFLYTTGSAHAEKLTGCAAKKHDIETQLKFVKSKGYNHKINELEKALQKNIQNCNDSYLRFKREQKILEKQKKLEIVELKLQHAKNTGNLGKINERQKKFKRAQQDLNDAKAELNQ